jgi:prepilin peptidase CpaA
MELLFPLIWMAICAGQDARQRRIANTLTLGVAAAALIYLLLYSHTWLGAPASEGGWALLMALLFTLPGYLLGRMGAGDVKLMVALALLTDRPHVLGSFIGAAVAALLWRALRQKIWPLIGQGLAARYSLLNDPTSKKDPFAPFLFVGFLLTALLIRQSQS